MFASADGIPQSTQQWLVQPGRHVFSLAKEERLPSIMDMPIASVLPVMSLMHASIRAIGIVQCDCTCRKKVTHSTAHA